MKIIILFITIFLTACSNSVDAYQIQCNSKTIAIMFNDDTMDLIFDSKSISLKKVMSASGIKYKNQSALVWLKGNDAIVTINDTKFKNCKLIDTL